MQKLYILLVAILVLPSCSTRLRIEKRHYRPGFYLSGTGQRNAANVDSAATAMCEENLASGCADEISVDAKESTTSGSATTAPAACADSAESNRPERKEYFPVDTVVAATEERQDGNALQQSADIPEEARGLNAMWWIALTLLIVGVSAAIIAFVPAASAGFGVLIGAAPFLIVGALVLSLVVLTSAKRRMQSAGSAVLSSYYDQLRKRAKWVALVTAGAILVFLLFLVLVIVALSNFQ